MHHQVENSRRDREGIKVALDFLLFRIFDAGIVDHKRNSIWFVMWILDWASPLPEEWRTVISMSTISLSSDEMYMKKRVSFSKPLSRNPNMISLTISSVHLKEFNHVSIGRCSRWSHNFESPVFLR